jgi:hypothetical protein
VAEASQNSTSPPATGVLPWYATLAVKTTGVPAETLLEETESEVVVLEVAHTTWLEEDAGAKLLSPEYPAVKL